MMAPFLLTVYVDAAYGHSSRVTANDAAFCVICRQEKSMKGARVTKAILTDVQFWIPGGGLVFGVGLLVALH